MSIDSKVSWAEGMFVRPQHFQQEARYVEYLTEARVAALRPYPWGVRELEINRELLATGRFAITRCRGIFEDGTPFGIPAQDDHPQPLTIPDNARNVVVGIGLPIRQPGGIESSTSTLDEETVARYRTIEIEVYDGNEENRTPWPLRVGRLRLRYLLGNSDLSGMLFLGLARIVEVRADGQVVLDERYAPPVLDLTASGVLTGYVNEIVGLLHHRGEALAMRVSGTAGGVAELSDFLMLQAINRAEPVFKHLSEAATIHPERLFHQALALAGELATFTNGNRRPPAFPAYRHDDLQRSFMPVMDALRRSLSTILEQAAVLIPLEEHRYGIRTGLINDRNLIGNAAFVLTAKAAIPTDRMLRTFPAQMKIGTVDGIRELVNSALPGIRIRALPVAPRQIPYHTGVTYFELDRTSPIWKQIMTSGNFALHISGDFPDLELEFWAIKD